MVGLFHQIKNCITLGDLIIYKLKQHTMVLEYAKQKKNHHEKKTVSRALSIKYNSVGNAL